MTHKSEGAFEGMPLSTYSEERLAALLPWPDDDANKYTRGKLVLVAGCAAYPGAACLAAGGASRVGAGYVQVQCAAETAGVLRAWQPSLVVTPWEKGLDLHAGATEKHPVAYAVGSGFDARDDTCVSHVLAVLQFAADARVPLLVDGGALSIVAAREDALAALQAAGEAGAPIVVTPHGGEAARIARSAGVEPPQEGAGEQAAFAQRLAAGLRATVVLKGPDTYIASNVDAADAYVVTEGTPALAKAGTGDILAGMIGGLMAQGLNPADAAVLGVTLHARAGRAAAERLTTICVTPEDVLASIPDAVRGIAAEAK